MILQWWIITLVLITLVDAISIEKVNPATLAVKRFVTPEDFRDLGLFPPLTNNPPSTKFTKNKNKKPTCKTPVCHWKCKEPSCKKVCKPWCYRPDCAIKCDDLCVPCKIHCPQPKCIVRCLKTACSGDPCTTPHCVAICPKKIKCKTKCKNPKPTCKPVCEPTQCDRKCFRKCDGPAKIERPSCNLVCQLPKCKKTKCEFPNWFPCKPLHWNNTRVSKHLNNTGFVNSVNLNTTEKCCPCHKPNVAKAAIHAANSLCHKTPNCTATSKKPTLLEVIEQFKLEKGKHCCPCEPRAAQQKQISTSSVPPNVAALARYGLEQLEANHLIDHKQEQQQQNSLNGDKVNHAASTGILGPLTPPNMPAPGYPSPIGQRDNTGTLGQQLPV